MESGRDNAKAAAYAAGCLALEAVFIRSTLASLRSVLGAIVGKLASAYGSGAACAAADGPLPIGDIIGLGLAVGGRIWSIDDLCHAQKQLSRELSEILYQSIHDCRDVKLKPLKIRIVLPGRTRIDEHRRGKPRIETVSGQS